MARLSLCCSGAIPCWQCKQHCSRQSTNQGDEVQLAGPSRVQVVEDLAEALGLELANDRLQPGLGIRHTDPQSCSSRGNKHTGSQWYHYESQKRNTSTTAGQLRRQFAAGMACLGVGGGVGRGRVLLLLPARQRLQHLLLVGVLLAAAARQRKLPADYAMLGSIQTQIDIVAAARPAGRLQPPAQRECRASRGSSCQSGSDAGREHVSGQPSRHACSVLCRESCAASLVHRPSRHLVTTLLLLVPDAVQVVTNGGASTVARLHRRPPCSGREQRPPCGGVHRRR
jgi:hypothetical protein